MSYLNNKGSLGILIKEKKYILLLTVYTLILVFAESKMSFLYATNEWADPNVYFTIGKAIFNGQTLYVDTFDHKGPFIFFLYGLGYWISNTTFFGVFLIEIAHWLFMVYAVYLTARLFLVEGTSLLVAAIFPVFLVTFMKAGGSAEEFILVYEILSLYFFVKYFKDKDASIHKPRYMFIHGLMVSIVFFTKINLVMFWFFPLAGIFINLLLKKEFKNCIANIFGFIGGFLVIALPIIGYFVYNNALEEAYGVYIELNRNYAQLKPFGVTLLMLVARILYLFLDPVSLLFFVPIGVFYFPFKLLQNTIGKWVICLAGIATYVVIYMSPAFQYYYPIPLLVISSLGLIGFCVYLTKFVSGWYSKKMLIILVTAVLCIALGKKFVDGTYVEYYVFKTNDKFTNGKIAEKFSTQALVNEIKKEKNPTLLNLGFGLGVSLFTTCDIVPNVRYFMKPNLSYEIYPELRNTQTKYIEEKATQFIVFPEYLIKEEKTRNTDRRKKAEDDLKYYRSLPAFKENYTLVIKDTIQNRIDENSMEVLYLYKRNETDSIK